MRLTTKVSALPNSAHQRIHSWLPLGKNNKPKANKLGMKITSDINSVSVSIVLVRFQ
jgi:hypothetical protein